MTLGYEGLDRVMRAHAAWRSIRRPTSWRARRRRFTCSCRRASSVTIYVTLQLRRRRRRASSPERSTTNRALRGAAGATGARRTCSHAAACTRTTRSWTSGSRVRSPTWR